MEIKDIALNLLSFKTTADNKEEFTKLFNYIKEICNKELNIKEYEFNGKKSLVVANTSSVNLDIIFCTHVDIVPIENYKIIEDEENIYGRGTIDMKGSVASCLYLMNHLHTNKKIGLFITSDEEIDGNCCVELLKIYNSKFAIVPDGGNNFDLIVEEKGALQLKVIAKGISAHASQPFNGCNAIAKIINLYNKLLEKYPLPKDSSEYKTTINLSKIIGGTQINCVPDYAEAYFDIRHISTDSTESIIKYVAEFEDIDYEILLDGKVFKTDLDNNLIKNYISACESVLNKKIKYSGCESTSDAIYFYEKGIPTIIMNPIGYYPHNPKEYVNKNSLITLYKIYDKFINNFK